MTIHLKYYCFIILSFCFVCDANAQSEALLSQYFNLPTYYNTAAAGNVDYLNIATSGQLRQNDNSWDMKRFWVGADMPFVVSVNQKIGAGITANYNEIGVYKGLSASLLGSWKLKVGAGEFSIGISPCINNNQIKPNKSGGIAEDNKTDSVQGHHKTNFDIGVGLWYDSNAWWGGFSITHLGFNKRRENKYFNEFTTGVGYYFTTGCNIKIKSALLDIEPSVLATHYRGELKGQATLRIHWNKLIWAGAGYRLHDGIGLMVGTNIKGFMLGYSYLFSTGSKTDIKQNGHEFVAGYRLKLDMSKRNPYKHKSIRLL